MKCPKCGYEKPEETKFKKWSINKTLKDARMRLKKEIGFGVPIKRRNNDN